MEKLAQLMASWAEPSPAVAALVAVRSQRVANMPYLVKAGCADSTAPITVIEHFHGAGQATGTGRLNGAKQLNGAGRFDGERQHKDAGRLNGTGPVNGTDTGTTGGPGVDASENDAGSVSGPRREAWTESSPDPDLPIQRPHTQRPEPVAVSGSELTGLLEDAAALLDSARLSAAGGVRLLGFVEAAD
ncbi:hypothetical protein J7I86_16755, partial [Arthrobacter sp. ISL-95]|nr:hypothetical protein [Arthrobacter sp. ISL-95]